MSKYYGYLTGNRGSVTRCGSKKSGINAHLRSWSNDVYASLANDKSDKQCDFDMLVLSIPKGLKTIINGKEVKV